MSELLKEMFGGLDIGGMAKDAKKDQKETQMTLYAILKTLTEIKTVLEAIQEIAAKKPVVP